MSLFDPIDQLFGVTGEDPGAAAERQGLQGFSNLTPPSPEELKVQLQQMVYRGDITPEMAQTVMQDPSKMNEIMTDPSAKSAQLQALQQLQGISTQGGMTATDKAQLGDIQSQQAQAERGTRGAIQQNAAERGISGSGLDLASEMANQQGSATRGNQAGLDVAAQAQQRALQAIQASGQLGGQIEGQNFGEAASKATAADAINKFNTQNRQSVQMANVAATNAANARNVETKQNVSDQNTGIANTQAMTNAQAHQTAYQDALSKASGVAGAENNIAAGQRTAAGQKLGFEGGLIGTAGQVGAGYLAGQPKATPYDWTKDPMFA